MRIFTVALAAFFTALPFGCGRTIKNELREKTACVNTLQNENIINVKPIVLNSKNIAEAQINTKENNVRILIYPPDKSLFTEYSMSFQKAKEIAEKYNVKILIDGRQYTEPQKTWGTVELKGGQPVNIFDKGFLAVAKKFEVIEGFIEWIIHEYILAIDEKLKGMSNITRRQAKSLSELEKSNFAAIELPSAK